MMHGWKKYLRAIRKKSVFATLAGKYGKSNVQVILCWYIQSGNGVIPGPKNPNHIRDNFDLLNFELTEQEMAKIAAVNQNKRYYTSTPEVLEKYAKTVPRQRSRIRRRI